MTMNCVVLCLCVLGFVSQGMSSVIQTISVDRDGNVLGCKEKGHVYNNGDRMPAAEKCQICLCGQRDGQDYQKECYDGRIHCDTNTRCIDQEIDEDTCCPYCPNGSNCWLSGRVVSACDVLKEKTSDPLCQKRCKCPDAIVYERYGKDTQASCATMCA